jgi:hypothetical protein
MATSRNRKALIGTGIALVTSVLITPGVGYTQASATHAAQSGGGRQVAAATAQPALASTTPVLPEGEPEGTMVLPPPAVPGVAALPGPVAAIANPSPNMGILNVTPDEGPIGTPITIQGSNLPPATSVQLTWSTSNVTWLAQPEPGTVNYLGRDSSDFSVVVGTVTTSANGAFSYKMNVPSDFGGPHDIYAVANGMEQAHGGFLTLRTVTISPTSGPVGTPITVTYTGLGATLYTGGASLLYDNHYVGEMMANWTRGTARVVLRASGPPGRHVVQVGDAISFLYLNWQQSPIPFINGGSSIFTVTKDSGPSAPSVSWPDEVAATVSSRTTLVTGSSESNGVTATLSAQQAAVGSSITVNASGLSSQPVDVSWATVVGSRVDCKSTCWAFASTPLGTADPVGGSARTTITVPQSLGGWHVVQLHQGSNLIAQLPVYVHVSIVGQGVSQPVLKEGQEFTIHLNGVGWTQLDNTVAVDYDNSYVGYACGFASNGDVVLHLRASGGPGTHLIDIYPMLYTLSPSFASTPYGMVPMLTYAQDSPALALGYRLPALHFAVTIAN